MTDLDQAKVARADLQAQLAAVSAQRDRAATPVAALEREEAAAHKMCHDAAVSKWLKDGGQGQKPRLEDIVPEATPAVHAARQAAARAQPELQRLTEAHDVLHVQHSKAQADVVDAAAKHMTDRFADLGIHARELRAELREIEEVLAGAAHYFAEASDYQYARTGKRSTAIAEVRKTALESLADLSPEMIRAGCSLETPGLAPPMPTRSAIAVHREQFEALQR